MSRLITFGCSYTQGHTFPDCLNVYEPPSKYAWPAVLGNLLGLEVINKGKGGICNLQILWNILHFDFNADDICIIMWSHNSRDLIFDPTDKNEELLNGKTVRKWRMLQAVHTEYDLQIRHWLYAHQAYYYLNTKVKQHWHMFQHSENMLDNVPKPCKEILPHVFTEFEFENYDFTYDNLHPGEKSHKILANRMATAISKTI